MLDVGTKYLSEAIYLVRFKNIVRDVRLKQADAERAFMTLARVQSQQTNVPDDLDPNAPRIIFHTPRLQVLISQTSCQLTKVFEAGDNRFTDQVALFRDAVPEFFQRLLAFTHAENLAESAVVLTVKYPCSLGMAAMSQHLFEHFFKQHPQGQVASFSFKVGYRTEQNFYLNQEINVYQLRRAEFNPPIPGGSRIDIASIPISEEGVEVKVDVNDKPRAEGSEFVNRGPAELLTVAEDFAANRLDQIMGFSPR